MHIDFNITAPAATRITELGAEFRISVLGGGCSGFQYEFIPSAQKEDGDTVFIQDGAYVYIDDTSLEFLNECTLDYVEELGSARFEIKNPHAKAKCGCGNSFSV